MASLALLLLCGCDSQPKTDQPRAVAAPPTAEQRLQLQQQTQQQIQAQQLQQQSKAAYRR